MKLRIPLAAFALAATLTACGSGPTKRVHPSTASIQQLAVQADGSWKFDLRIQNFSTMPMHYSSLKATVVVAGTDVGEISIAPNMDIVANGGDVVEATLKTSAKLPASGDFAYTLKGTIDTSEPKESFPFERSSRLSPVPGVPNTYR
ncbi:hypothetical protein [Dokdonella sp.]|uniref:hypothetical protein n=1 Tax=Dokdonella sp. TaxID=2291710 RepID=UPI001B2C4D17|nr:hypothetical protein [Dokdonella sp.]MBO9665015.1 hypothetical protein [Dokdonella sp.]